MTVYNRPTTQKQKKIMRDYESITGFEFLHQDEIDSGDMTFNEAWKSNRQWYQDYCEETIGAMDDLYSLDGGEW